VNFFVTLFSRILVVCGKVNFTNLSRYSELNEKTYRRHFEGEFEFGRFNQQLIEASIPSEHGILTVMDASFIRKSGKATFGLDRFWNGSASRVERGLEVSLVAVVDLEGETGYALSAQQTLAQKDCPDCSRLDQALHHLQTARPQLPSRVQYLAVDGAYAKTTFIHGSLALDLHVITKLRCDANLKFLYTGAQQHRGRPRKYDGKVDLQDLSRFTFVEAIEPGVSLYTALVWSVAWKCPIRVAYLLDRRDPKRPRYVVLCSTDTEQDATEIYRLYRLRFQIEFIFRDSKQFTGLEDCQARSFPKLEFHFNAAFSTLNLAKLESLKHHSPDQPFVFSMASVKRRAFNEFLLNRFICKLDLDPTLIKSHPNYSTLCEYGIIAT
jgi:Transposase DDE domain